MDDDVPICYRRFDIDQIHEQDPEFRWLALQNDRSIGDVEKHYKAGIIQMRIYLGETEIDQGFKTWPSKMRGDDDIHRVLVHIFQVSLYDIFQPITHSAETYLPRMTTEFQILIFRFKTSEAKKTLKLRWLMTRLIQYTTSQLICIFNFKI